MFFKEFQMACHICIAGVTRDQRQRYVYEILVGEFYKNLLWQSEKNLLFLLFDR
jgi:hypothetical protein